METDAPDWLADLTAEIWSTMLYPNGGDASKFLNSLYAQAFLDVLPELPQGIKRNIPIEIGVESGVLSMGFKEFCERGLASRRLQSVNADIFPGEFVGDALLLILAAFSQGKNIGICAIYRCYKSNKQGNIEKTLGAIWNEFKSVSHLWAAFLMFGAIPQTHDEMVIFLSFADYMRRWGISYTPDRAREPLLGADAVAVDPSLIVPVELPLSSLQPSQNTLKTLGISAPSGTAHFTSERIVFSTE